MGRFNESVSQYEKALAVNPHFVNSMVGIASCRMYQNRHDEALAELQTDVRHGAERR